MVAHGIPDQFLTGPNRAVRNHFGTGLRPVALQPVGVKAGRLHLGAYERGHKADSGPSEATPSPGRSTQVSL